MSEPAENSDAIVRRIGRPFQPGQSGNPGGRPKGVARTVREACGGSPLELARILLEIARDETGRKADRIAATRELTTAFGGGHSVVVYQHFPRVKRPVFLADLIARVEATVGCPDVFALWTPHVAFVCLPQPEQAQLFRGRACSYLRRAEQLGLTVRTWESSQAL